MKNALCQLATKWQNTALSSFLKIFIYILFCHWETLHQKLISPSASRLIQTKKSHDGIAQSGVGISSQRNAIVRVVPHLEPRWFGPYVRNAVINCFYKKIRRHQQLRFCTFVLFQVQYRRENKSFENVIKRHFLVPVLNIELMYGVGAAWFARQKAACFRVCWFCPPRWDLVLFKVKHGLHSTKKHRIWPFRLLTSWKKARFYGSKLLWIQLKSQCCNAFLWQILEMSQELLSADA